MESLSERQEAILRLVVQEFLASANPVGSRTIAESYRLGVSPATIRNEMAYLEEQGYLSHPHTSAGRVPTERGYRYFVQRLMEGVELAPAQQRMIRHQFHQVQMTLEGWMRLSAAILARTAEGTALVAPPQVTHCHLKHLELISIHDHLALLVLMLQEGAVKQQFISTPQMAITREELQRMANALNEALTGLTWDQVEGKASEAHLSPLEREIADQVSEAMREIDERANQEIYHDGLLHLLRQPEFNQANKIEQLLWLLEEKSLFGAIFSQALTQNGVQVIIGGEGQWQDMSDYSLVLSRYGIADQALGVLGVLGPLRMPYGRAIAVVRYVATLMSDLVQELWG